MKMRWMEREKWTGWRQWSMVNFTFNIHLFQAWIWNTTTMSNERWWWYWKTTTTTTTRIRKERALFWNLKLFWKGWIVVVKWQHFLFFSYLSNWNQTITVLSSHLSLSFSLRYACITLNRLFSEILKALSFALHTFEHRALTGHNFYSINIVIG